MEKVFMGKCPFCQADCYGEAGQAKVTCDYCGSSFYTGAGIRYNQVNAPTYGAASTYYQNVNPTGKKKSNTGLVVAVLAVIAVLIFAAIGVGGYAFYNRILLPAIEDQQAALNQGSGDSNFVEYDEEREIPDQDPELNPENMTPETEVVEPEVQPGDIQEDGQDTAYGDTQEDSLNTDDIHHDGLEVTDNSDYDLKYPNDADLKVPEEGLTDKAGFDYYNCRNIVMKDMKVRFPDYWDTQQFDDEQYLAYNYDDEFAMYIVSSSDGVSGYNLTDKEFSDSFLEGLVGALGNGELVSSENRTIGDIDGLYAEYKANYNGVEVKGTIFAFINGDTLYGYQLGESSNNAHDYTPDFIRSLETITSVVDEPAYERDDEEDLSSYTNGEKLAILEAKSYIRHSAFSRDGLIHQLSAEYGEGFTETVATMAVDHLEQTGQVDWYEQCLKAIDEIVTYGSDDYTRDKIFRLLTLESIRAFPEDLANKALDEKGY
ncbi:MAG: Ltp family lipoprotein [Butyrivibrio sp.]|nr:Ltp family lipoprotein [Butyrivibrio sp.]